MPLLYYIRVGYILHGYIKQPQRNSTLAKTTNSPEDLLPLTPTVFNILLALADGEKHGYGIMLEVESNTNGTASKFQGRFASAGSP